MLVGLLSGMAFQANATEEGRNEAIKARAILTACFGAPFLLAGCAVYNYCKHADHKKACLENETTEKAFEESLEKNDKSLLARVGYAVGSVLPYLAVFVFDNKKFKEFNQYQISVEYNNSWLPSSGQSINLENEDEIQFPDYQMIDKALNFGCDTNLYDITYSYSGRKNNSILVDKQNQKELQKLHDSCQVDSRDCRVGGFGAPLIWHINPDKDNKYVVQESAEYISNDAMNRIGWASAAISWAMLYFEYCRTCAIAQAKKDALEAGKSDENKTLEESVIVDEQENMVDHQAFEQA